MATHKQFAEPGVEMQKIDQAIEELKARKKQLMSRGAIRTRLLRYLNENGYTRADIYVVLQQMPKLRITARDREVRLKEIRNKHAPKRKPAGPPVKPELAKFGARLRREREAKGLTAAEVAKTLERHPTIITAWERGKWGVAPHHLAKLEKLYGVKLTNGGNA